MRFIKHLHSGRRAALAGFTLVEVMVTVLISGFGLLSITQFQTAQMFESANAKNRTEATELARQKIEEFRSYVSRAEFDAHANGSDTLAGESASYNRSWSVARPAATQLMGQFMNVTVTVQWLDRSGSIVPQVVSLTSAVAWVDPQAATALYP